MGPEGAGWGRWLGRWGVRLLLAVLLAEATTRALFTLPGLAVGLRVRGQGPFREARGAACDASGSAGGQGIRHDPVLGWRPAPGEHLAAGWSAHIDARGARVHPEPRPDDPSRSRVVLLGDSFTFGDEVDDDQTWVAALAARRPELELVNLGVSGYGLDQVLLRWREEGVALTPERVVLGWVDWDVARTGAPYHFKPKPWVELGPEGLVWRGIPVPTPAEDCARSRWKPLLPWVVGRLAEEAGLVPGPDPDLARARALAVLDALHTSVVAAGAELVVVGLVASDPHEPALASQGLPDVRAWCAERGVVWLEGGPVLAGGGVPGATRSSASGHPGPEAGARLGAWLAEVLPPTP